MRVYCARECVWEGKQGEFRKQEEGRKEETEKEGKKDRDGMIALEGGNWPFESSWF